MATTRGGFALIEVLVVVSVILLLAGILIPAVGVVRTRARIAETKQTLRELQTAFALYRNEDPKRLYPTVAADLSVGTWLQDLLEEKRHWARGGRSVDAQGRLLDPWRNPYRYSLTKPLPAAGSPDLTAWNWDADKAHERAWGSRLDPAKTGAFFEGPLPYAYLWSLGMDGNEGDARSWILREDAP